MHVDVFTILTKEQMTFMFYKGPLNRMLYLNLPCK